jgi:glycerol-3-phosphate O-acyltransferase
LSALTQGGLRLNPSHTEKAQEIIKSLLREIISRYGLPLSFGSDNGPAFIAEIVQGLAKLLKTKMETPYSIQASEFRESRAYESNPQNYPS